MNADLTELMKFLPLIIPIVLLQLGLQIWALVDLAKRDNVNGPKWVWALIIVLGEFLGAIIYFIVGKKE